MYDRAVAAWAAARPSVTQPIITRVRKTGLRLLGDVPWGGHVAFFYEREEHLVEMCVPFLKAGLESNEVSVWEVPGPLTEGDAWAALGDAVPALDRFRAAVRSEDTRSSTR